MAWMKPVNAPFVATNLSPAAKSNMRALHLKTNLVLMGFTSDGTALDIRVPVTGIFDYKTLKKFWDRVNLIDIESFRECFNLTTSGEATAYIPPKDKNLLVSDELDMDSLFSENITDPRTAQDSYSLESLKQVAKKTAVADNVDIDAGAYQIVLVKLKDGIPLKKGAKDIAKSLKAAGADGRTVLWQKAAGQVGDFATIIRVALNTFVMILFLVAAIIIMNTLSMAALERTTEIGMMRAVGARKSFISDMFLAETGMLSFVFGGAGVVLGIIIVNLLALPGWTSDNEFLQLLFGGDKFQPILYAGDVLFIILQLAVVTLLAAIYPVLLARKITPLEAIARD
jgi:ABC-type antimicrobial peptide transport system permease subunit